MLLSDLIFHTNAYSLFSGYHSIDIFLNSEDFKNISTYAPILNLTIQNNTIFYNNRIKILQLDKLGVTIPDGSALFEFGGSDFGGSEWAIFGFMQRDKNIKVWNNNKVVQILSKSERIIKDIIE